MSRDKTTLPPRTDPREAASVPVGVDLYAAIRALRLTDVLIIARAIPAVRR